MHEHVEVVKGNRTKKILEVNDGGVRSIEILRDTIAVHVYNGPIYLEEDSAFGYWIARIRTP